MSGAGETNVDGKAHKEGDEVRRRSSLGSSPSMLFSGWSILEVN